MSDGPSKRTPEAEPLDDIILGDDDPTDVPPTVQLSPSFASPTQPVEGSEHRSVPVPPASPPRGIVEGELGSRVESVGSLRTASDASGDPQTRKRKMTLRIPDDEVSRPNEFALTPSAGIPVLTPSRPPPPEESLAQFDGARSMTSSPPHLGYVAEDTIVEIASDEVRARVAALTSFDDVQQLPPPIPAFGIDATHEPGWTPFQPDVENAENRALSPIQPTPIIELKGNSGTPTTILDAYEVHNAAPKSVTESAPPPASDEIPVDMDFSVDIPDPQSDEIVTRPRLPFAPDSEEIRIDESDRVSEVGEVEVEAEDLVSVESLPSPTHPSPPPMKSTGNYGAFKVEGVLSSPSAASLMAGTPAPSPSGPQISVFQSSPPAGAVTPTLGHAAVTAPASLVTAPSSAQTPAIVSNLDVAPPARPGSSSGGMAARRPVSPTLNPPIGALAPPPMTDGAASRKKIRPWWEELFNDDFIRTMAKVTDSQIGMEVNFIEESLGCEAGAMILDLACGTGRHAVELAARGYQVVGFDLSLAMLARASDEAQDRKQKINFVQGDMREMTFEETFDGVYSWNTSFGFFDEEKNGAVIARVHKSLKKGGQFLLDVVNRDFIVRQAPSLAWFEGDGCICMDEMTIDFIASRMRVKRTLMMDDGRTKEIEYSIRVYSLHELGKMLHDNGFRVAEISGRTGTPGVFFGCESPRTLILAEKR